MHGTFSLHQSRSEIRDTENVTGSGPMLPHEALEARARERLPQAVFDYIVGGSGHAAASQRLLVALCLACLVACAGPEGASPRGWGRPGAPARAGSLRYDLGGSPTAPRPSRGGLGPQEAERWRAEEAKLEEYLQWGMRLMEAHAVHLRRIAPGPAPPRLAYTGNLKAMIE